MIRDVCQKDFPNLLEIYNEVIESGTASFEETPLSPEEWSDWLKNSGPKKMLVFEKNGQALGYAALSSFGKKRETAYSISAELSIYIDENARGMGIGEQLMKAIIDYACKETALETIISVITEGNTGSVALHEKMDFVYCGKLEHVARKKEQLLSILYYQKHLS